MTQKPRDRAEQRAVSKPEALEEQTVKAAIEPEPLSFDEFLEKHAVHPGLAASYRYEARTRPDLLQEKNESDWWLALEEQSKTQY